MAKVETTVIPLGNHRAAQGTVEASRSRVAHWIDNFRKMKEAGRRIPVPWGHQPKAVPTDEATTKSDTEFWGSRLNAGYVDDLFQDANGALKASLDVPGLQRDKDGNLVSIAKLPDGREVATAIKEVSGAIRDFRDGKGQWWPDSIIHIALTPHPVVAGQNGFQPAPGEMHLSLFTLATEAPVDEEKKPKEEPAAAPKDQPKEKATEGGQEAGQQTNEESEGSFTLSEVIDLLRSVKQISLPDNTTDQNFFVRLGVALKALQGSNPEESMGSPNIPKGEPKKEEKPDFFLSLSSNPLGKSLLDRERKRVKDDRLAKIKGLGERGLQPAVIKQLEDEANGATELSLTADGAIQDTALDRQLALLDEVIPKQGFEALLSTNRVGATEIPAPEIPERNGKISEVKAQKLADELMKNSGIKRAPAAATA